MFLFILFCVSVLIAFVGLKKQLAKSKTTVKSVADQYSRKKVFESKPKIELRKNFKITYTDEKQDTTEREIQTYSINYSSSGECLILAHCSLREDFRSFRVDRINSLIDLDTGEEIQGNFRTYLENMAKNAKAS